MDNFQAARENVVEEKSFGEKRIKRMADIGQILRERQKLEGDAAIPTNTHVSTHLFPVTFKEAPALKEAKLEEVVRFFSSAKVKEKTHDEVLLEFESINVLPKDQIAGETSE